ncbi:hypothetical protein SCYAM73S_08175 [Streptomyces cyaneofuscatus]
MATKAKASGMPPKLASTPEAVSTAPRSAPRREVTTAWAISTPKIVAMAAVSAESSTLPVSEVR